MKRTRREKPLYTMEEICKMNGVEYDTTSSTDTIKIIDSNNIIEIDSSFNLFESNYKTTYILSLNNSLTLSKRNITWEDCNKKVDYNYKKGSDISGKIICTYKTAFNKLNYSINSLNVAV